jgi:hypothetical protein
VIKAAITLTLAQRNSEGFQVPIIRKKYRLAVPTASRLTLDFLARDKPLALAFFFSISFRDKIKSHFIDFSHIYVASRQAARVNGILSVS